MPYAYGDTVMNEINIFCPHVIYNFMADANKYIDNCNGDMVELILANFSRTHSVAQIFLSHLFIHFLIHHFDQISERAKTVRIAIPNLICSP